MLGLRMLDLGMIVIEGGFPHSEIRGSKLVRSSPRLIAAYHVLHRLSAPRHPPDALKALDRSHRRCPFPSAEEFDRSVARAIAGSRRIRERPMLASQPIQTDVSIVTTLARRRFT